MATARTQRILFITSNSIGDAVMSAGVLAHLVDTRPEAQFTVVCGPAARDLFRAVPRLARLIVLKKKRRKGHWVDLWKMTVGTRWDMVVDLRNSAVSRLIRARRRAFLQPPSGRHKIVDNAACLGLAHMPPTPRIWLDAAAEGAAAQLLARAEGRPIVAMGPIANWAGKEWPIEKFAELAERLTAPSGPLAGGCVLVIAAPHEREKVMALLTKLPPERTLDTLGHDMLVAAACIRRCQLFVGNDSGLMHLAGAMGTPTVGLFGPGNEAVYAPWGEHSVVVRTPESHQELVARRVREPEANMMQSLAVDTVMQATTAFLAGRKKAA
ncbi:MAG: glycosyltransferase family 9 protein [Rickettsiales bacterium]